MVTYIYIVNNTTIMLTKSKEMKNVFSDILYQNPKWINQANKYCHVVEDCCIFFLSTLV